MPIMLTIQTLENQAITAAKKNDWPAAVTYNQEIIATDPKNVPALNRLGFAYLQENKIRLASKQFKTVLEIEKHNLIAQKQLANIKNKTINAPQFQAQNFVEEPSKSKIFTLNRLASKQVLQELQVGQELSLKPKNRFISIETLQKTYLGSLPEDISLHLTKLINSGNKYLCQLHSQTNNTCTVFIRETYQSSANKNQLSFKSVYKESEEENIGSDLLLLTDDVPINIISDENEGESPTIPEKNEPTA